MSQAAVQECSASTEDEAKGRFEVVGEFEMEMDRLSDQMSKHSLACTMTRLSNNVAKIENEEKTLDGKLLKLQTSRENMMGERPMAVDKTEGWKEVGEVAGMCEVAKGRVEDVKRDISLLVER